MNWKKPRGYNKDEMLYPDRCMMKWQGMILSDHNERIEEDKVSESLEKEKSYLSEQELEEWDILLRKSQFEKVTLRFRINHLGEEYFHIIGNVEKIKGKNLYVNENGLIRVIHKTEIDEIIEYRLD